MFAVWLVCICMLMINLVIINPTTVSGHKHIRIHVCPHGLYEYSGQVGSKELRVCPYLLHLDVGWVGRNIYTTCNLT